MGTSGKIQTYTREITRGERGHSQGGGPVFESGMEYGKKGLEFCYHACWFIAFVNSVLFYVYCKNV